MAQLPLRRCLSLSSSINLITIFTVVLINLKCAQSCNIATFPPISPAQLEMCKKLLESTSRTLETMPSIFDQMNAVEWLKGILDSTSMGNQTLSSIIANLSDSVAKLAEQFELEKVLMNSTLPANSTLEQGGANTTSSSIYDEYADVDYQMGYAELTGDYADKSLEFVDSVEETSARDGNERTTTARSLKQTSASSKTTKPPGPKMAKAVTLSSNKTASLRKNRPLGLPQIDLNFTMPNVSNKDSLGSVNASFKVEANFTTKLEQSNSSVASTTTQTSTTSSTATKTPTTTVSKLSTLIKRLSSLSPSSTSTIATKTTTATTTRKPASSTVERPITSTSTKTTLKLESTTTTATTLPTTTRTSPATSTGSTRTTSLAPMVKSAGKSELRQTSSPRTSTLTLTSTTASSLTTTSPPITSIDVGTTMEPDSTELLTKSTAMPINGNDLLTSFLVASSLAEDDFPFDVIEQLITSQIHSFQIKNIDDDGQAAPSNDTTSEDREASYESVEVQPTNQTLPDSEISENGNLTANFLERMTNGTLVSFIGNMTTPHMETTVHPIERSPSQRMMLQNETFLWSRLGPDDVIFPADFPTPPTPSSPRPIRFPKATTSIAKRRKQRVESTQGFLVIDNVGSYRDARAACSARSARLATIRSPRDHAIVLSFNVKMAWIGLSRAKNSAKKFVWSDGRPFNTSEFDMSPSLTTLEATSPTRDCVAYVNESSWDTFPCTQATFNEKNMKAICQLEKYIICGNHKSDSTTCVDVNEVGTKCKFASVKPKSETDCVQQLGDQRLQCWKGDACLCVDSFNQKVCTKSWQRRHWSTKLECEAQCKVFSASSKAGTENGTSSTTQRSPKHQVTSTKQPLSSPADNNNKQRPLSDFVSSPTAESVVGVTLVATAAGLGYKAAVRYLN